MPFRPIEYHESYFMNPKKYKFYWACHHCDVQYTSKTDCICWECGRACRPLTKSVGYHYKPKEWRQKVFRKDKHKCRECGSVTNLTIDHIIPKSKGGTNYHHNLQTLCYDCNQKKGNKMPADFNNK